MYINRIVLHREHYPTDRYYPFDIPALRGTDELILRSPIAFFVGENGSGKSTLLEAVTRKCGIHIWDKPKRHVVHQNPYEDHLHDFIGVTWANGSVAGSLFRAESFREFADFVDDLALCDPGQLEYYGGHILNTLSHGQGILSYLDGRFQRPGLYLLDEPESALSPSSQIAFLQLLQRLEPRGTSQFIIATHSPILLACPGAQIFAFGPERIKEVQYEDTSHYRIYSRFMQDPRPFLNGDHARARSPHTLTTR